MEETVKHIKALIEKAAETDDSGDAMRYAQAALNAANAALGLANLKED